MQKSKDITIEDRKKAIHRHDLDSGIFQGRYVDFKLGKYTNEFIYGRYQLFEEVLSDLSSFPKGAKVLDLGCGTGHLAKFIKDKGFDVVGLDPSQEMLKLARSNFSDIEFVEGVSAEMKFNDNTFDYVVSIEVLRYLNVKDVSQTYKELYRILKPGGKILVTHVNLFAMDFYFFYYHILGFLKRLTGGFYHKTYFTTPSGEEKLVKDAGFSKVETLGRMFGSIRIFYKFGGLIGRMLTKVMEKFSEKQFFSKNPRKALAGHLIIRAVK